MDESGLWEMQSDGPITNLRRPKPSPLYEDSSENKADLPRYQKGFNTVRFGERSKSSLTSEPSTNWSKGRSRRSCSFVTDRHWQFLKSPTLLSPKRSWSTSSRSSRLQPLTATLERVTQFNTSDTFGIRYWSTPAMFHSYAYPSRLAWKAWIQIGSTPCLHILFATSRR